MAKAKKLKVGRDNIIKILIDKMLEKYGIDYDYVVANEMIDGKLWCSNYEWTLSEAEEYKKWWIKFWQENVIPRYTKKYLEREYMWFNLMWGLKIKDYERR